jgi:hypothetical protein
MNFVIYTVEIFEAQEVVAAQTCRWERAGMQMEILY